MFPKKVRTNNEKKVRKKNTKCYIKLKTFFYLGKFIISKAQKKTDF